MARKTELRLFFPAAARNSIAAHPKLAGCRRQGEEGASASTYFDTAKLALMSAGVSLSIRPDGSRSRQTLARMPLATAGLAVSQHWASDYAGNFDFSAIADDDLRRLLGKAATQLQPVFTVETQREIRQLSPSPGVSIRLTIETGRIVAADRESPVADLTLELLQGEAGDLRALAIELAAALPLTPLDAAPAERGYRLLRQEPMRPQKVGRTPIAPTLTPAEAFGTLARQGLRSWQANLHGARISDDPEFVHQLRVALRRLDTLMKIFKPALPEKFSAHWSTALKDVAASTGDVRDLDVMRDAILLPALADADSAAGRAAIGRAIAACDRARRRADTSLAGLANGIPLLAFAGDLEQLPAGKADRRISGFAERRLAKLHARAVRRFAEVVGDPTPRRAHRLRIALKHLRYGGEFFASLFDEAEVQAFAKQVAKLQDELGFLNDCHVALARLDRWSEQDAALTESRDCIAAWYAGRMDAQFTAALRRTEAILGLCLPWCGKCERRGLQGMRKKLRRGISPQLD